MTVLLNGRYKTAPMMVSPINPFVRLKRYRPDERDAKENHSTECLAACLRLSLPLRRAFLRLCHAGACPLDEATISEVKVLTQEPLDKGIFDLYLTVENRYHLVIEVKVDAKEAPRHREQAVLYSEWLQKQVPQGTLLSLLKTPDRQFQYDSCGIAHRLTWREVFDCFRAEADNAQSETDAELARAFCGYLVSEGIVMNYDIKSLVQFADGMKAQSALETTFSRVAEELAQHGFQANARFRRDQWPRLEVKNEKWSAIFGEGQNYRIYLWFQVPGIWNATEHEFWLTLELYNREYPSNWESIQPRLEAWFQFLGEQRLKYEVYPKNWNQCELRLPASQISSVPVRISAYKETPVISQAAMVQLDADALVKSLVDEVRNLATLIDQLPRTARPEGSRQRR